MQLFCETKYRSRLGWSSGGIECTLTPRGPRVLNTCHSAPAARLHFQFGRTFSPEFERKMPPWRICSCKPFPSKPTLTRLRTQARSGTVCAAGGRTEPAPSGRGLHFPEASARSSLPARLWLSAPGGELATSTEGTVFCVSRVTMTVGFVTPSRP